MLQSSALPAAKTAGVSGESEFLEVPINKNKETVHVDGKM